MLTYYTDISERSILPYTRSILYKLEIYLQEISEQIKSFHQNKKRQLKEHVRSNIHERALHISHR